MDRYQQKLLDNDSKKGESANFLSRMASSVVKWEYHYDFVVIGNSDKERTFVFKYKLHIYYLKMAELASKDFVKIDLHLNHGFITQILPT